MQIYVIVLEKTTVLQSKHLEAALRSMLSISKHTLASLQSIVFISKHYKTTLHDIVSKQHCPIFLTKHYNVSQNHSFFSSISTYFFLHG